MDERNASAWESALQPSDRALVQGLDPEAVLTATLAQLQKDLDVGELRRPADREAAFEDLRLQVLVILQLREREGATAFGRVVNRVDLTEVQLQRALGDGGLPSLAGAVVVRCLQKVLSRLRFAGLH